ncbi:MAG: aldehyde dehydrogenase family protein, partial [Planctomycetaceae bacterium]
MTSDTFLTSRSPIDGGVIGTAPETPRAGVAHAVAAAQEAFVQWRQVPAPRRGELVRLFAEELRHAKGDLAGL